MKKGFTLVEVMVTIMVSMLLLGAITSSVFFVSSLNSDVLDVSTANYQVKTVRDFILDNRQNVSYDSYTVNENGDVYCFLNNEQKDIVKGSKITKIDITLNEEDKFITYTLFYLDNKQLTFTVGVL